MLPVGVQRFVAGSYSSALAVYEPPPATSTRPSARRTATCSQRGWFSVPPGLQVPVDGSYSSVVDSPTPPTTRTRPFRSGVAVMWARAVAMLAVAVQLPEPEPEATVGTARTKRAQPARTSDFMLTTKPPFLVETYDATIGRNTSRRAYEFLKPADVHFCAVCVRLKSA